MTWERKKENKSAEKKKIVRESDDFRNSLKRRVLMIYAYEQYMCVLGMVWLV